MFYDPAFAPLGGEIDALEQVAWEAFDQGRKAPRTEKAGTDFADPSYDLSSEWLDAKKRIDQAEADLSRVTASTAG